MQTSSFLALLQNNPGKELIFEYQDKLTIPKAYHITEVKNVYIDAVDCGGRSSESFQTVVQLWVSDQETADKHMLSEKALQIFEIVDSKKPMRQEAPILFEWGHGALATSVYEVQEVHENEDSIQVKMTVPPTICKPKYELEVLGQCAEGGCC